MCYKCEQRKNIDGDIVSELVNTELMQDSGFLEEIHQLYTSKSDFTCWTPSKPFHSNSRPRVSSHCESFHITALEAGLCSNQWSQSNLDVWQLCIKKEPPASQLSFHAFLWGLISTQRAALVCNSCGGVMSDQSRNTDSRLMSKLGLSPRGLAGFELEPGTIYVWLTPFKYVSQIKKALVAQIHI